jgi:hypothetical protein
VKVGTDDVVDVGSDAPLVDGGIPLVLDGYGSSNRVAEEERLSSQVL